MCVTVAQLCLTLKPRGQFSRPEYWSGQPFPSPGDLLDPGIEPGSPALHADSLPTDLSGKSLVSWFSLKQTNKKKTIALLFGAQNSVTSKEQCIISTSACLKCLHSTLALDSHFGFREKSKMKLILSQHFEVINVQLLSSF